MSSSLCLDNSSIMVCLSLSITFSYDYLKELSYNPVHLSDTVLYPGSMKNKVFVKLIASIVSEGGLFFLSAPGGTRKIFLVNLLLAILRKYSNIIISVFLLDTGATLPNEGKTAHSTFKLPLKLIHFNIPLCKINKQSDVTQVLWECKLITWDELTIPYKSEIQANDEIKSEIL